MRSNTTAEKVLSDLIESTIEAKAHYQVWWALVNQARPKYVATMNRYPDFFIATQRAHFDSMVLNLAHIFDKRIDVSSIFTYLALTELEFTAADLQALRGEISALVSVVDAIKTIRHKSVAHKDAALNEKQVFALADVTPNQIRDLILDAVSVIEGLRRRKGWANGVFESERFSEATLRVLSTLEEHVKPNNTVERDGPQAARPSL